jgi:hypothetical protein
LIASSTSCILNLSPHGDSWPSPLPSAAQAEMSSMLDVTSWPMSSASYFFLFPLKPHLLTWLHIHSPTCCKLTSILFWNGFPEMTLPSYWWAIGWNGYLNNLLPWPVVHFSCDYFLPVS